MIVDMKDMNYKKYFVSGVESGAQKEREQIVDYLRDLQCDVLAYNDEYSVSTLQKVITWIEDRDCGNK